MVYAAETIIAIDEEPEPATDGEMAAALSDLDRKIAASGGSRVAVVRIASSKGV